MAKMVTDVIDNPGSHGTALANMRWSKASDTYRKEVGRMLTEARLRKRGKVRSKRGRKAAAK